MTLEALFPFIPKVKLPLSDIKRSYHTATLFGMGDVDKIVVLFGGMNAWGRTYLKLHYCV